MERNNTTINVSNENRDKINSLRIKWKLKTQDDVINELFDIIIKKRMRE